MLTLNLNALADRSKCEVQFINGAIQEIRFPQYLLALLADAYQEIKKNPDVPFPSEDSIGTLIPAAMLTEIDTQQSLPDLLHDGKPDVK